MGRACIDPGGRQIPYRLGVGQQSRPKKRSQTQLFVRARAREATRTFGELQYIPTGAAANLGADLPGKLLAMIFATKAGYRQNAAAAWMASTPVVQALSELKDSQGRPLYLPSLREGTPGTLIGFPMIEAEHMPAVSTNSFPMAFGNWQRGYTIADRSGVEILRDPYTKKGFVQFYIRKRVGGTVRNSDAIKVLKVATT